MKTPYFLIDESSIEKNCKILDRVRRETGCKILLAQKAYSCYDTYPLIAKYLDGTTASGLFEAKLGKSKFIKPRDSKESAETHVFAPAFTDDDMREIVKIADHIVFNSKTQLLKHYDICKKHNMQIGVRVNPECRTQEREIYDPCAPCSRFGIKAADLDNEVLSRIDGLHFHTLCEQGFEPLKTTLAAFEQKFGKFIPKLKWINFGGGHHITREDYDINGLITLINDFKKRHNVQVYLEPGEAVVLNSATLHATVLDTVHTEYQDNEGTLSATTPMGFRRNNEKDIAILNTSAACHNPDILETQHHYTPPVRGATNLNEGEGKYTKAPRDSFVFRLTGNTCLAGDIIGDYAFNKPLSIGDEIIFEDTALYTMVRTSMFNGINTPSIYVKRLNGKIELLREFGFKDFITRLGK